MIRVFGDGERCSTSKRINHWDEQLHLRQSIARALQEQHRDTDLSKVLAPLDGRLAGGMKRKTEEHEAAHAWEHPSRLRLRGHAAAEGLTSGE
jgi:hypothetical protein